MALRLQVAPELVTKVTRALGITALDQWYHVSHHAASKAIGPRVLLNFGGTLAGFLKYAYPHHQFDEDKLSSKKKLEKDQKFVEVIIRQLFPNTEILTKARKEVGIVNPETEAYLEIDFWIPSLKLGIEYQDKHHFGYQWYANNTLEDYQKRDDIKKVTMSKLGYTLITIGYWWDKTIESVAATIRKFRPDLLQEYSYSTAKPISLEPPHGHITESTAIPGAAGLMSPFIPSINFDPTNWYAGEKHDGVRGVFNPKLNKIFSRSGQELSVLSALLNDIPNMLVEGEIIAGRGNYNKTAVVSHHAHYDKVNWPMFRYVLFDIPDAELESYSQRYSDITRELTTRSFIFAQSVFRVLVINKTHLEKLVDAIISDSGEGVIAQKDARYEYGRAKGLAKIKVRRDDDAQVLSVNKLSCTCKLASGITADISFNDDFDRSTITIGDIVAYYHNGYSQKGYPKRGEIYKVRYDINWEEIVSEKQQNVVKRRSVKEASGSSSLIQASTNRKKGYWNKTPNVRAFFDAYARTSGFDPHVVENWYQVGYSNLHNSGGSSLLKAFSFSLQKALACAYPELKFEKAKFKFRAQKGYWNKASNLRAFFDKFAEAAEFNPLVPENWHPISNRVAKQAKVGGLLKHYSIIKALAVAYPELEFKAENFRAQYIPTVQQGHWNHMPNVRAFFDELARTTGFDPQVAENWNQVKYSTLRNSKGAGLLSAYGHNLKKALASAYPELKFGIIKTSKARTKEMAIT